MKNYTKLIISIMILLLCASLFAAKKLTNHEAKLMQSVDATQTVWTTMSNQFTLETQNPQVQHEINHILANRAKLNKILKASEPYIYYIYQQTQAQHLPPELALIPAIESEFSPNDYSSAGARGLWQLMPGTARIMGLKVSRGNDERKNFVISTNAALHYFSDLNTEFKSNWYLALAAYNSGDGRVKRAMRKAGSTDFWQLKTLPSETKIYVPKFLAMAEIIKNPQKYNVTLPDIKMPPMI